MFNTIKELRHAGNKARVTHYRYVKFQLTDLISSIEANGKEVKNRLAIAMNGGIALLRYDQIRNDKAINRIMAKGGVTRLEVTTKDGVNITTDAVCCGKDNYDKKLGVKIALGRLNL